MCRAWLDVTFAALDLYLHYFVFPFYGTLSINKLNQSLKAPCKIVADQILFFQLYCIIFYGN